MKFSIFQEPGRRSPYGVRYHLPGHKFVRSFHRTRKEAEQRRRKLEASFAIGGIDALKRIDEDPEIAEVRRQAEEAGETISELVRRGLSVTTIHQPSNAILLRQAFERFILRAAAMRLRTSTIEFYTQELERFMASVGENQPTSTVSRELIHRYLDTRPLKSRIHALRAIRCWLRWMLRQEP